MTKYFLDLYYERMDGMQIRLDRTDSAYRNNQAKSLKALNKLTAKLTPEQKALLFKFMDMENACGHLLEANAFEEGFRMCARLVRCVRSKQV